MEAQKSQSRNPLFIYIIYVIIGLSFLTLLSSVLERILPEEFEVLDFFSELSVLTFSIMWFLIIKQIEDSQDRIIVSLGIGREMGRERLSQRSE